jgi:isocitrate dehydrogenase
LTSYLIKDTIIKIKNDTKSKIVYTLTDEALVVTYSSLPIVQAFTATAGIEMETKTFTSPLEFYLTEFLNEDQK